MKKIPVKALAIAKSQSLDISLMLASTVLVLAALLTTILG